MSASFSADAGSAMSAGAVTASPVRIRPVRPDDVTALADFVRTLSPASRQRRFHAGVRELSAPLLERFTHPDPLRERALVAMTTVGGREVCVGEARYTVSDDHDLGSREFALTVADLWQRSGIGRRLLCDLTLHASAMDLPRLFGDLMRDNLPMLALAESLGYLIHRHPADPRLLRVVRTLNPASDGGRAQPRCCQPEPVAA